MPCRFIGNKMSSNSQPTDTRNDSLERVDYDALDKAKLAFIAASKKTLSLLKISVLFQPKNWVPVPIYLV